MNLPVITVSQLNLYIKKMFDSDLSFASVILSGEISNLSPHYRSGHVYFSLKDENSSVKAVMFAREASRLRFRPENGMKVIAFGRVSVFERDGVYQLYVKELEPDGAGALSVAFEQLKKRLESKGWFDPAHKKPLPAFPKRVGVITSPNGAALQDILNIIGRRFPLCEVIVAGVTVQGNAASGEIIEAVERFNKEKLADVLIVGRGGGSAEDLWCFNDEALAAAVYKSEIPVISAVGHETDFTICDFVSDVRAPTPSAAAELAVPDIISLTHSLEALTDSLYSNYVSAVREKRLRLELLTAKRSFSEVSGLFEGERRRLEKMMDSINNLVSDAVEKNSRRCQTAAERLNRCAVNYIGAEKLRFAKDVTSLKRLDPLAVLLRGYAAVELNGTMASSVDAINVDDDITVLMSDGQLRCRVEEKRLKP
ncbi:MAG: exodeoxyribonuclease VII large subunit [Clostridia bacterium]|nr:exodeoxyribonuclease VII large subunit [Clostridia bacterium]